MPSDHSLIVRKLKKYFHIEEFVSKEYFESFPEETLWCIFDTNLLKGILWVREKTGLKITINNWKWGGSRVDSGFRGQGSNTGAKLSGHRLGRCADLIAADMAKLRIACMECPYFTEIEAEKHTPGWVHVSTRPHFLTGLRIINP